MHTTFYGLIILAAAGVLLVGNKKRWFGRAGGGIAQFLGVLAIISGVIVTGVGIGAGGLGEGGLGILPAALPEVPAPTVPAPAAVTGYVGDSSTVTINAYDREADSLTEGYPSYYILDDGGRLVEGVNANSTDTSVGNLLSLYGDDDTRYYTDAIINWQVPNRRPSLTVDAHRVAAETSMAVVVYDDTITALGASINSSVDYNTTLGASESKTYYVELQNAQSNRLFRLGAFCTGVANTSSMDKVTVKANTEDTLGYTWSSVPLWREIRSTDAVGLTITNQTADYQDCFAPDAGFIDLHEWDKVRIEILAEAGSDDPECDLEGPVGSGFFGQFFDVGYTAASDGTPTFDVYAHDENERHSEIGVAEDEKWPGGKNTGFTVNVK